MASLRSMDAFMKPRDDLQSRSALGGIITVVAAGAASLLFLAQVYLYAFGSTRHSLHLSQSSPSALLPNAQQTQSQGNKGKISLKVHITFPHVACVDLDCAHDNAYYSTGDFQKLHGNTALRLKRPTLREITAATGGTSKNTWDGCTVQGTMDIPMVGGTFTVTVSHKAWRRATGLISMGNPGFRRENHMDLYNVSHFVHSVTFGEPFPLTENPLENSARIIENEMGGVGLSNVNVRLVPTRYKYLLGERDTYQVSVTEHLVQPEFLAAQNSQILPGLALTYDFTPLTVHHVEYRDNFFVFLSSLVSIVGGVFVTVGLVTGCLVHSAAAVAKKKD